MTAGRNLIVNYLPPSFRDLDLMQLFQPFGRILQVKVVRNKENNESLTYGFVLFASSEDALKALESLNGYSIYGKHIKVSLARRRESLDKRSKLYVTRIPANFTWEMTHDLFSQFGNIIEFRLLVDEEGKSRQIAFVEYSSRKESDKALTALSGYIPKGEKQSILVKYAIHPNSFPSLSDEDGDEDEIQDESPTNSFPEDNYEPRQHLQLPQSQQNIYDFNNYSSTVTTTPSSSSSPYFPINYPNQQHLLPQQQHQHHNHHIHSHLSPSHVQLPPQAQVPHLINYAPYPPQYSYQPLNTLPSFPLISPNHNPASVSVSTNNTNTITPTITTSASASIPQTYNLSYNQSYSNKPQTFISTGSDYERYQESYYSPHQSQNRKQYGVEITHTASTPAQNETKYLVVLSGLLPHHDIFTCQFISSFGRIVECSIKQKNSTNINSSPTINSSSENTFSVSYTIVPKTNLQVVEILKLHNTQFNIDGANIYAQVTTI